jgi:DNA-directed RNA polymerase subunit D
MEVKQLSTADKNKASFLIKGTNAFFVNTIRRLITEEVPVMAIEDIEFRDNSSALYDEIIAHRLGLLPLSTDLKSYNQIEECTCEGKGCAKCQLKMILKAKGAATVYASEIKSKDPKVKPIYPKTPIVKLLKGQRLELEATAQLGKGKDHSKFTPALAYYQNYPIIEFKSKITNPEQVVASCPVNVFELKKDEIAIIKDNHLKCHLCQACVDASKGAVQVTPSETEFIFNIESWGQLAPRDILKEAVKILTNKLDDFNKELK